MKKWNKRRWIVSAALIVVTGGVALNLLAYRHAYAMMYFTKGGTRTSSPEELTFSQKLGVLISGVEFPRPHTDLTPDSLDPFCQDLRITCPDGVRLGAWYCGGSDRDPLVLLFHGYGGEKTGMINEAKAFLGMGASVMLVDFRGSGESSESYTTIGYDEAQDVAATVAYAKEHLNYSGLVLYGQSMGAAAVLRAVHCCGVRPDAIIVEAVFDRMLTTVEHRFAALGVPSFPCAELLVFWGGHQGGFDGFEHNPVDYAASVNCPITFIHGTDDPRATVEEARRVFREVKGPKQFKEFPGLGHAPSLSRFPEAWRQSVKPYLDAARIAPKNTAHTIGLGRNQTSPTIGSPESTDHKARHE